MTCDRKAISIFVTKLIIACLISSPVWIVPRRSRSPRGRCCPWTGVWAVARVWIPGSGRGMRGEGGRAETGQLRPDVWGPPGRADREGWPRDPGSRADPPWAPGAWAAGQTGSRWCRACPCPPSPCRSGRPRCPWPRCRGGGSRVAGRCRCPPGTRARARTRHSSATEIKIVLLLSNIFSRL